MRADFHLYQECSATGIPQPTVRWAGNLGMKFIRGNVLEIKAGDLEKINEINPLLFTCTAENSEGEDKKIVKILIKINLTKILNELVNVTDEKATNIIKIITINTNGVNTSAENTTEIRKDLEKNAKDFS